MNPPNLLEHVSRDCLSHILSLLSIVDLARFQKTCRFALCLVDAADNQRHQRDLIEARTFVTSHAIEEGEEMTPPDHVYTESLIHRAMRIGNRRLIGFFLDRDPLLTVSYGFHAACQEGNLVWICYLTHLGASQWREGMRLAAFAGHVGVVELLVHWALKKWKGYYPSIRWTDACHGAAEGGHLSLLQRYLGRKGLSISDTIYYAARGHQTAVIDWLTQNKKESFNLSVEQGLKGAAEGGHFDLLRRFEEAGASDWRQALYHAAKGNQMDMVQWIMSEKRLSRTSALLFGAIKSGNPSMVEFLFHDLDSSIPFQYEIFSLSHTDTIKYLILHGTKPAIDVLLIESSWENSKTPSVRWCLSRKAKVKEKDLIHAINSGTLLLVRYLVEDRGCVVTQDLVDRADQRGGKEIFDYLVRVKSKQDRSKTENATQ